MNTNAWLKWLLRNVKQTSVEPFMFFFMFGFHVRYVTFQNLLIDRGCRHLLEYSEDVCDNFKKYKTEHADSVRVGNNLYLGCVMLSCFPALVISSFVGPWSDLYGRRLPLIIANCGICFSSILAVILSTMPTISPLYFFLSEILTGITGGIIASLSQTYSYLSDITNERTRPTRFAVLEFFFIVANPIGTYVGGQLFQVGKAFAPMLAGTCSFAVALLCLLFFVKETKSRNSEVTAKEMVTNLCQTGNVRQSFETCIKKRPGNLRLQIWLLIIASCSTRLINIGTLSVTYSYVSVMFEWGVPRFSTVAAIFNTSSALATVIIVPLLNKRLLVHEAAVGLAGTFSLMAKMVVFSVSFKEELIYYAWFCGLLSSCGGIAIRSRMSKLVSKTELGRVYSLLATCEAMTPVLGTFFMTQIYNASVQTYSGLPYAIAALILVPTAAIFSWLMTLPTMSFAEFEQSDERKRMQELNDMTSFI